MFHLNVKPSPPSRSAARRRARRSTPRRPSRPRLRRVDDGVQLLQERDGVEILAPAVARSGPTRPARASSRGRASTRRRRRAARRRGTPRASRARSRARKFRTSWRAKLKTSVPQSGCAPRRGSACSYSAVPSKRASAHSSRGKCAGTQSRITPMPAPVQRVDEGAQVVGLAQRRLRRVVAAHLIAPRADRYGCCITGISSTCVNPSSATCSPSSSARSRQPRPWPPRAGMHLVDRHRRAERIGRRAAARASRRRAHAWRVR